MVRSAWAVRPKEARAASKASEEGREGVSARDPDAAHGDARGPQQSPANSGQVPDMRSCPLGGGREFKYGLPADGMKVKDAWRVAVHLITVCEDYEPETMGSPMQVMAAISNRDGEK